jgi:hypothetical protein
MKKALLVGINYPNTHARLHGCINDVLAIEKMLTSQYGFKNKRKLLDNQATTHNILKGLKWLVAKANPGDTLFFHYSGHGSQMADVNGDEKDGLDEIICPIDLNWKDKVIKDDHFRSIFSTLPDNVNLTVILDCCHSGDGLRGGLTDPNAKIDRRRWLPAPQIITETIARNNLSPKGKLPTRGVLISGCTSAQTSADAWFKAEKKYMGACTYFLLDMLKRHNYNIDYHKLVLKMNHFMKKAGYSQTPQLNCDAKYRKKIFLSN